MSYTIIALVTCAGLMSGAAFPVLAMNHRFAGIIQVSSALLEAAPAVIGE